MIKQKEILKSAREQQQFFLEYSQAYFSETKDNVSFSGMWETNEGFRILLVQHENSVVIGKWIVNLKEHEFKAEARGRILHNLRIQSKYQGPYAIPETLANRGYAYMSPNGQNVTLLGLKGTETVQMRLRKVEDLPFLSPPSST